MKNCWIILQCKIGVISPFWQYIMQNPIKRICKMAIPVRLGFIHFFWWGWPDYRETLTNYRKNMFLQCKLSFFKISQSHPTIMTTLHTIKCMKPSRTGIAILHILFIGFWMIYCQKCEITPILHCKIIQQFCNFFLLFLISMHQKPHIFHQCGYLQHMKLFLARNNAF